MTAKHETNNSGSSHEDTGNDVRHSEELAHQLVRHLGINAARKTCAENHWMGVLDAINFIHKGA